MVQSIHNQPYESLKLVGQIGEGSTCRINKVEMKEVSHKTSPSTTSISEHSETSAEQNSLQDKRSRYFAIKELDLSSVKEAHLNEFENEIKILRAIDHPRIVKIFQTFRLHEGRISAILMEMCQGGDLYSRPSYSERDTSLILYQILSAAAYLHDRNVVHRDLKFQNILFVDQHNLDVKIIDFGLAKKYQRKNEWHYEKCGTLYTMSPEVVRGKYSGSSTDLWSIGVIAFMLLSNQKPFWGSNMNEVKQQILTKELSFEDDVWKAISDDTKGFVTSLLQRNPENRPTAREALGHEFILKYQRPTLSSTLDLDLVTKIHTSMKCFAESSHFKKTVLLMIASRYPSDEILHLVHIFTKLDKSGEGVIHFSDFKEFLSDFQYSDSDLKIMFGRIEINNTGHILYTEFLASTLEIMGPIKEQLILEAYDQIDVSSKGFITMQDLQNILPTFGGARHDLWRISTDKNIEDEKVAISKDQFCNAFYGPLLQKEIL